MLGYLVRRLSSSSLQPSPPSESRHGQITMEMSVLEPNDIGKEYHGDPEKTEENAGAPNLSGAGSECLVPPQRTRLRLPGARPCTVPALARLQLVLRNSARSLVVPAGRHEKHGNPPLNGCRRWGSFQNKRNICIYFSWVRLY